MFYVHVHIHIQCTCVPSWSHLYWPPPLPALTIHPSLPFSFLFTIYQKKKWPIRLFFKALLRSSLANAESWEFSNFKACNKLSIDINFLYKNGVLVSAATGNPRVLRQAKCPVLRLQTFELSRQQTHSQVVSWPSISR